MNESTGMYLTEALNGGALFIKEIAVKINIIQGNTSQWKKGKQSCCIILMKFFTTPVQARILSLYSYTYVDKKKYFRDIF